jgi:hypothetical protein
MSSFQGIMILRKALFAVHSNSERILSLANRCICSCQNVNPNRFFPTSRGRILNGHGLRRFALHAVALARARSRSRTQNANLVTWTSDEDEDEALLHPLERLLDGNSATFSGANCQKSSLSLKRGREPADRSLIDKKWAYLAEHLRARIAKECRERWYHHLDPIIMRTIWTVAED